MNIETFMQQLSDHRQQFLENQEAIEDKFNQDLNNCLSEIANNIENINQVLMNLLSSKRQRKKWKALSMLWRATSIQSVLNLMCLVVSHRTLRRLTDQNYFISSYTYNSIIKCN